MEQFFTNLKREAEANPTVTLAVIGGLFAGTAKLIDAVGHHKGSTAYAKMVENSIKKSK